ncbi:MAG TPA: extracellular solute-binding protein [Candidatus Eisenbacteria bacterium]|nr:extracellular solute-binding protein [Candidatus Eisenbacteria bacterium]
MKETDAITVWHWMSDREDAFEELASRFEQETGTKVHFELYAPSEAYAQRVKASAQTHTLPDVYGVLGEKRDFASFINSGYVLDLTPELGAGENGAWKDSLFARALAVNEFLPGNEYGVKPGIYGVPLDVMTIQMVYNQSLYEKAGLDPKRPPETWQEFIAHCRVLKEKGIPRFVSGFGEIWMIDALASNFAMNIMGEDKVFATYRGEVPYTDPDWVKVLALFKEMTDEGVFVDGAVTMVNKTAEQTFANERAAYAFNGSWCINVYKGMNPSLKYGAILPPKVTPANPMRIWGGAGSSFVVNAQSPRKDKAVKFLRWLTSDKTQAFLAEKTENLPSNKNSLSQITPVLAQFADDMDNSTHPNVYPVHEKPAVTEAFDKGIQSILIGEKTPEAVAEEVQRIKEKEQKKS